MGRHRWRGVVSLLVVSTVVAGPAAAADEAPAQAAPSVAPVRHGSAFVDPLGFLLFGPRLGVEAGAGHVAGAAYARWFNVGVLSQALFVDEGSEFGFSYGVGARGRYYLSEGLEGLHFGVAAEFLRTRIENPSALIVTRSAYVVPHAEAGYRLSFGSFYGDASAALGYAFKLSGRVENLPGGSNAGAYEALNESEFYGSASLDLGVYF